MEQGKKPVDEKAMRFRRKMRHSMPGLNTTSTADISFMLLIFFLVTTSMETMKGLGRKLPPMPPDQQEKVQDIDRSNVMTLNIGDDSMVSINGKTIKPEDDKMREDIKRFIMERGASHIIELQVSRNASYDAYFHLQNQIIRTYKELRQTAAEKRYGKPLELCTEDERNVIVKMYPQRLTEISQ